MANKKATEKRETIWEQEYRLKQEAKELLINIKEDERNNRRTEYVHIVHGNNAKRIRH